MVENRQSNNRWKASKASTEGGLNRDQIVIEWLWGCALEHEACETPTKRNHHGGNNNCLKRTGNEETTHVGNGHLSCRAPINILPNVTVHCDD